MAEPWERFLIENQFTLNKELLQCGICDQLLSPPTYLSSDARNICGRCKTTNSLNPAINNESLDAVLANAIFPCKYVGNGCDSVLQHASLQQHQFLCHYSPKPICPICKKFSKSQGEVEIHCIDVHSMETTDKSFFQLKEYFPLNGVAVTFLRMQINDNDFYIKVTQKQIDLLEIIVCCPIGVKLNLELLIQLKTGKQVIQTKANVVESWNMLNSTDHNHVASVYLSNEQKTAQGTTKDLTVELIFNNNNEDIILHEPDNFRKDIECPICMNYFTGKIYKCRNAHNICQSCQTHITTCPICREDGIARDFKLENLLIQFKMYCINAEFGCMFKSCLAELRAHELKCIYIQFSCHVKECTYTSTQMELIQHYKETHRMCQNGSILSIASNIESWNIVYMGHIFLLNCQHKEDCLIWSVTLINSTAVAYNFVYTIQVLRSNQQAALTLTNICGNQLKIPVDGIDSDVLDNMHFNMKCFIKKVSFTTKEA